MPKHPCRVVDAHCHPKNNTIRNQPWRGSLPPNLQYAQATRDRESINPGQVINQEDHRRHVLPIVSPNHSILPHLRQAAITFSWMAVKPSRQSSTALQTQTAAFSVRLHKSRLVSVHWNHIHEQTTHWSRSNARPIASLSHTDEARSQRWCRGAAGQVANPKDLKLLFAELLGFFLLFTKHLN
ncbi:hypothetical protein ACLB2K_053613 [Fragaria x ananassa]